MCENSHTDGLRLDPSVERDGRAPVESPTHTSSSLAEAATSNRIILQYRFGAGLQGDDPSELGDDIRNVHIVDPIFDFNQSQIANVRIRVDKNPTARENEARKSAEYLPYSVTEVDGSLQVEELKHFAQLDDLLVLGEDIQEVRKAMSVQNFENRH